MPKPRVIEPTEDFPIMPTDIDLSDHMWDAFGNQETEISARYLMRLAQKRGDWLPFTREEIEALYNEAGFQRFGFNHLIGEFRVHRAGNSWWERLDVIVERDGKFYFTDEFVTRCYRSRPIPRLRVAEPVGA
jgi:hypothetical protein